MRIHKGCNHETVIFLRKVSEYFMFEWQRDSNSKDDFMSGFTLKRVRIHFGFTVITKVRYQIQFTILEESFSLKLSKRR